jgi:hypothetical protein
MPVRKLACGPEQRFLSPVRNDGHTLMGSSAFKFLWQLSDGRVELLSNIFGNNRMQKSHILALNEDVAMLCSVQHTHR